MRSVLFCVFFVKMERVNLNVPDITHVQSLSKVYMLRYFKVDQGSAVGRPLPYYSDNFII